MRRIEFHKQAEKAIRKFPQEIRDPILHALLAVQMGTFPENAKVLSGFGNANVVEIRERGASGTYRCVYTIHIAETIYVLHAFQKKSKSGIATEPRHIKCIKDRIKALESSRKR